MKISIEISARHFHLSAKDLEKLFGKGYKLRKLKQLSQPGEFAGRETVMIYGPRGMFPNVRVMGPARQESQLEISKTDARFLGLKAPLKLSGDTRGSAAFRAQGPKGVVSFKKGAIIARRHLHISQKEADKAGLKNGNLVKVKVNGERDLVFNQVAVRVKPDYKLVMHLDTDEGNAAGIDDKGWGEMI